MNHSKVLLPAILAFGAGAALVHGCWFETHAMRRQNATVLLPAVASAPARPLKVVHIGDIHLGFQFSVRQLQKLVWRIQAQKPDIVLFTGDMMDRPYTFKSKTKAAHILAQLRPPLGKYAVWGNHDVKWNGFAKYAPFMQKAGFALLRNQSVLLQKAGLTLRITGLDDLRMGRPDISSLRRLPNKGALHFLLMHQPDLFCALPAGCANVVFAGHSHGGQINLPVLGPPFVSGGGRWYLKGLYKKEGMYMNVTGGLGTTVLPLRMLCPSEYSVLTIVAQKGEA